MFKYLVEGYKWTAKHGGKIKQLWQRKNNKPAKETKPAAKEEVKKQETSKTSQKEMDEKLEGMKDDLKSSS